jgi:hypothetical protein
MRRLRDATQNHTRTTKIRNWVNPSEVMVRVVMPMFADATGEPLVKKSGGIAIMSAKSGMRVVREKKCRSGIREVVAKIRGMQQIKSR